MVTRQFSGLRRSPWGEKKREQVRSEDIYCVALEQTFSLHRLDYWHCRVSQTSQPGWPDYAIFGDGWHAFMEVKARSLATGRLGKVSDHQRRWKASIEQAGAEWVTYTLPDDWDALDDWLCAHTGREIRGQGASA